jgi:putative transposase
MAGHALSLAGALSESVIAVADATGTPCATSVNRCCLLDNGGGETNKTLDADVTGIFSRLVLSTLTSIPGLLSLAGSSSV